MKISKDDRIIIIGAGLGGLTTALALQHHGFTNVHIYEKSPNPQGNKIPVLVGAYIQAGLTYLELEGAFNRMGVPWQSWSLHWKNGNVLAHEDLNDIKTESGFLPRAIAGPELYDFFRMRLSPNTIISDETFISFTPQSSKVEVHFESGRTEDAALLIGADGLNSRVRLQLLGESSLDKTSYNVYRILLRKEDLQHIEESLPLEPLKEYIGSEQSFTLFEVDTNRVGIILTVPTEKVQTANLHDNLQELFSGWASPIEKVLQAVPHDQWVGHQAISHPRHKKWHVGRVVMLGDAIHATLPFLSLRADMAIESGIILSNLLEANRRHADKALKKYTKQRRKRLKYVEKMASNRYNMLDVKSSIYIALRNWWLSRSEKPRFLKRYKKFNNTDFLNV